MPQTARMKDVSAQKAQDKEAKRARGALSCAECRRLKLKCDKTVPCSSCKRRGCSAICPNGSLITGQGTRFVLADTETLHNKISNMSDRIRQLEDALAILHTSITGANSEPHPLLNRDLLKIKSSIDLHSASDINAGLSGNGFRMDSQIPEEGENSDPEQYIDAFGTLAIRDDGAATFYGRSAGSESLLIGEAASPAEHNTSPPLHYAAPSYDSQPPRYSSYSDPHQLYVQGGAALNTGVANLAAAFPLAPALSSSSLSSSSSYSASSGSNLYPTLTSGLTPSKITLKNLVGNYLPPYAEAVRLVELYLEQAPWFFGAVTKRQIDSEILPMWYEEAAPLASASPPNGTVAGPSRPFQRTGTSHDLALLFILICFGHMTDINLPAPPDNVPSEKFYQLTKAALTLDPNSGMETTSSRNGILDRPPSVATVQTLSLMAIYEGICSGENSIESTWALMGLAGKLAQSIGLHRDSARWKLPPAEVQKRRGFFWELFITDCWQALATGRLATFSLPFVDCELPFDHDQTIAEDGSAQPSFPYWKARFGAECVAAVVQGTLTSRAPKYSIILDLDRRIRDMELPQYAQGPPPQGLGLAQTMSHFMPHNYRELTLLYIHRCFFAHAVTSNPLDPIKSPYAPSFLAGYRSACNILSSVKTQFSLFPAHIARFWVLWTHAFSASVMLASVATHGSRSKIAPAALLELKNACDLFEAASPYGGRAGKFLPILKRLQFKAQQAYRDANSGIPPPVPNDIFKPSKSEDQQDELSIFSGKTHTVNTKSHTAVTPPTESGATSRASSNQPRAASDSPPQVFADNPHFAGVHPGLVSELNSFHGHIKAQIQNAYRAGGDVFGAGQMMVDPVQRMPPQQHHVPQHHQQAQQMQMLQQQQQQQYERQEQERLEREREAAEMREMEQQAMERQHELLRQQRAQQEQMETQRRQHQAEMQRQQDIQRQQLEQQKLQLDAERLQRQEQYRQQLEIQQRQQQQQQQRQIAQYQQQYQQSGYASERPGLIPITAPPQLPATHTVPPQQTYQQPPRPPSHGQLPQARSAQPANHHGHGRPPAAHHPSPPQITPQHTDSAPLHYVQHQQQHPPPPSQQQHSMYSIPPQEHTPEHGQTSSSVYHYTPPPTASTSSYKSQSHPPASAPPHHTNGHHHPVAVTNGNGAAAYSGSPPPVQETYKYWPAASSSFAMPDQQPTGPAAYTTYHYTPEGALRGIAAEDPRLQETWQSYMNSVGSPRQLFED